MMDAHHADGSLARLESDPAFSGGYAQEAVRGFRKVMNAIRAAADERDLGQMRSLHFEKLKGDLAGLWSLRLNRQWRLIVEIVPGEPKNSIRVLRIEDYH